MRKRKPVKTCKLCECRVPEPEQAFCYGCQSYICGECDKTLCIGNHAPGDHLRVTYGEFHGD